MTKFIATHAKNAGRRLRVVDDIWHKERWVEQLMEEAERSARFTVNGEGSFSMREAIFKCALHRAIFKCDPVIKLIGDE